MGRAKTPKRHWDPDPRYNDIRITRLIHCLMKDGKKTLARGIVYDTFELIKQKTESEPMDIFDKATKNVTPQVEVKSKRIGGANLQIPSPVRFARQFQLFLRMIKKAANERKENTMVERLCNELIDASNNEGSAVKSRMNMDKTAQSNKAHSHLIF